METLTTSQRDYQRLINWCIAVTAACAAGASYLPAYSWPFIALAAISGAVALVAFLRKEATESSRQVKLARNSFDGASSESTAIRREPLGLREMEQPDSRDDPPIVEISYFGRGANARSSLYALHQATGMYAATLALQRYDSARSWVALSEPATLLHVQRFLDDWEKAHAVTPGRILRAYGERTRVVRVSVRLPETRRKFKAPKSKLSTEEMLLHTAMTADLC